MHLFLNGLAASAGGGLTYLRNVIPELSRRRPEVQTTLALNSAVPNEFEGMANVSCMRLSGTSGVIQRFWREQTDLPQLIRSSGADVLISAGNFALRNSPVPQILLFRNSLYTSRDFISDLRCRRDYRLLADTYVKGRMAKRSLQWADCAVAPTRAFAKDLEQWSRVSVKTIHHGFDRERFLESRQPLPPEIQEKLGKSNQAVRLLFVSHYNYYRNFETLFRAMPIIRESLGSRRIKLFLTCNLATDKNPGTYRTDGAAALLGELGIKDTVVELGTIPYHLLHLLYGSCHIYVSAAYTETFAHPLVEAMASGLPVVASDLAVHREVCGEGALYFERFSPAKLAAQLLRVVQSQDLRQSLAAQGLARSRDFSWQNHVDQILALARQL